MDTVVSVLENKIRKLCCRNIGTCQKGVRIKQFYLIVLSIQLQLELSVQRRVHIRQVFSFERCLYQRVIHLRELSVLGKCLYQRDVRIREVFVLERCPYQRGIRIREVSVFESCLYQRVIQIREVSVLESYPDRVVPVFLSLSHSCELGWNQSHGILFLLLVSSRTGGGRSIIGQ